MKAEQQVVSWAHMSVDCLVVTMGGKKVVLLVLPKDVNWVVWLVSSLAAERVDATGETRVGQTDALKAATKAPYSERTKWSETWLVQR